MQVTESALHQSVIEGRLEFFRSSSLCSSISGAAFQQNSDGSCYYCSGVNFAPCNGIIDQDPSEQNITSAIEFFQIRKVPFIWWTSSKSLEEKGFQFGGILTGIAMDISNEVMPQATSVRVKIISEKTDVDTFTEVCVEGCAMGSDTIEPLQAINAAGMILGKQIHFLAFIDDIPVGTATLSLSDASAGIWNLVTLPEYRKRGVGTALISAAIAEAKKLHHNHVMAILMPKGMAWGIFTKSGFKEVCQFPFYVYGASADDLER